MEIYGKRRTVALSYNPRIYEQQWMTLQADIAEAMTGLRPSWFQTAGPCRGTNEGRQAANCGFGRKATHAPSTPSARSRRHVVKSRHAPALPLPLRGRMTRAASRYEAVSFLPFLVNSWRNNASVFGPTTPSAYAMLIPAWKS